MAGPLTDKNRLLFGAGFVFGVMFTLGLTAVVTVSVAGNSARLGNVLVTIGAGTLFTGVIGTTLYLFAFPGNRLETQVISLLDLDDREER